MKTYDNSISERCEMPEDMKNFLEDIELLCIKKFLEDIKQVCIKHNLSISHEDCHGAFLIERYDERNIEWLFNADKNYKTNY